MYTKESDFNFIIGEGQKRLYFHKKYFEYIVAKVYLPALNSTWEESYKGTNLPKLLYEENELLKINKDFDFTLCKEYTNVYY